jgi:selenocysteine lyase/cysteine desulfurase
LAHVAHCTLRAGLQQIPGVKIHSSVHPALAGAVAVYGVEGVTAETLEGELWNRRRIRLRSMGDPLGVRQSCQIYNNGVEIDSTLEVVRDLAHKA